MPAPSRSKQKQDIVRHLNDLVPIVKVNNVLGIKRYLMSADLLVSQAQMYRASGNDEQLYVMLMRLASLLIETLPKHREYNAADPAYVKLKQLLVTKYLPELEQLKLSLRTREASQLVPMSRNRPTDAVQLSTSNLPQINWATVVTPKGNAALFMPTQLQQHPQQPPYQPPFEEPSAPPPPSAADDPFGLLPAPPQPLTYSSSFNNRAPPPGITRSLSGTTLPANISREALNRHALFMPRTTAQAPASTDYQRPKYPEFDRTPVPQLDLLTGEPAQPSAPALPAVQDLSLTDAQAQALMQPSAGPSLGPQEVQVQAMDPSTAAPGTCATCPPPPPPDTPTTTAVAPPASNIKEYTARAQLRDVHISVALMEEFLRVASSNTRKGIEFCGILAGSLSANDSLFSVTTLILPKQTGTSDTVAALNEEEIFDVQMERGLYPLGWIHTHPTQTCFMSSVDIHTQCGYQTMLEEAVAIVMAPTDRNKKCGLFRLSTPGGLSLVQKCTQRGFHSHPSTDTGQDIYELCGHVYLNPRTKHETIDLRG